MILGKSLAGNRFIEVSKNAFNSSLLLTGLSGSGKTWKLRKLEKSLAESGEHVLVLDYHGTHQSLDSDEEEFLVRRMKVDEEGIPLGLFTPLSLPNGSWENSEDVANEIVKNFSYINGGLGSKQAATLRRAAAQAYGIHGHFSNDLRALDFALQEMERNDSIAADLREKFWTVFHYGNFYAGENFLESEKVNIYDFNAFDLETQKGLIELLLGTVWRYACRYGQISNQNLFIICDEFQILNLGKNGILAQILREGRKFHIGLILATQTLSGFSKETKALLEQVATRMYFRTTPAEALRQGIELDANNKEIMRNSLLHLRRGQCIVSGLLSAENGSEISKPLILAAEN